MRFKISCILKFYKGNAMKKSEKHNEATEEQTVITNINTLNEAAVDASSRNTPVSQDVTLEALYKKCDLIEKNCSKDGYAKAKKLKETIQTFEILEDSDSTKALFKDFGKQLDNLLKTYIQGKLERAKKLQKGASLMIVELKRCRDLLIRESGSGDMGRIMSAFLAFDLASASLGKCQANKTLSEGFKRKVDIMIATWSEAGAVLESYVEEAKAIRSQILKMLEPKPENINVGDDEANAKESTPFQKSQSNSSISSLIGASQQKDIYNHDVDKANVDDELLDKISGLSLK